MNSNIIETLQANGYVAGFTHDGTERVQIVGATHAWYYASSADYAANKRTPMRDPNPSIAVLEFEVSDASPLSARFAAELVKLIAPKDTLVRKHVRPLVRITPTSVQAIYRAETAHIRLTDDTHPARPELWKHGFTFADARAFTLAHLRAVFGGVLVEGGTWLNDASPLTVARSALPTFNSDETAQKLRAFVDKFIAADELRECGPYVPPRSIDPFVPTYGTISIDVDPRDWDQTDPRRNDQELVNEVRKRRRAAGLGEPQTVTLDQIAGRSRG